MALIASAVESPDDRSPFLIESDSLEALAIAASGGRVRRDNERLYLRLADDSIVTLLDQNGDAERLIFYRLRPEFRALGYYLVTVAIHEGGGFLLVHENSGRTLWVDGYELPTVSPDSLRLVATSGGFDTNYYPYSIQIIRLNPRGPTLEWQLTTGEHEPIAGWIASDPTWLDEHTVELTMQLPDKPGGEVGQRVPVWLDFMGERWRVRATPRLEREIAAGRIGTDSAVVSLREPPSRDLATAMAVANALVESLAPLIDTIAVNPERIELRVGEAFPMADLRYEALDSAGTSIPDIPMHFGLRSPVARITPTFMLEATSAGEAILRVTPLSARRGIRAAQWASTAVTIIVTP